MSGVDVQPTAECIMLAARRFEQTAKSLDRIAAKMLESNDLSYASEALSEVINILQSTRLDLLITRPIRALTGKDF